MGGGGIPECECDYGENKANSVWALSAILGIFISSDKHLCNDFHATCLAFIQIHSSTDTMVSYLQSICHVLHAMFSNWQLSTFWVSFMSSKAYYIFRTSFGDFKLAWNGALDSTKLSVSIIFPDLVVFAKSLQ